MKKIILLPFILLVLSGCQNQELERQLQKREADLNHREQELLLRENAVALREQNLAKEKQVLDSTSQTVPAADTALVRRLPGSWVTRMNCIETDCPGSALGDSKNEQWEISYEQDAVLVRASANNKVVRVYTGKINGSVLELTAQHSENDALTNAAITVQLQASSDRHLEGRREINKSDPDNCRIVYALELTREPVKTSILVR